ncbi:MAG: putative addiction module component (TIGR02574 family) [Rubritalea sp.]|jgi:putative addiction module component (TIGR02574 family)
MSEVAKLIKKASVLGLDDRVELVSSLLEELDPHPHYVSDQEVEQRFQDLKSGKVKGLTEEEFWKACGRS